MAWYWWVLLVCAALFIARAMSRRGEPAVNELAQMAERLRDERADLGRELAKVVDVIVSLPIIRSQSSSTSTLSRQELDASVRNFLESKLKTEWSTATKMVHIVMSPTRITAFAKLQPTGAEAAARVFTRIADDAWIVETRHVNDMQTAIRQAEQDARG